MKTITRIMKLVLVVLISALAGEKANAQVIFTSTNWTSPGPSFCDGENFELITFWVSNGTDTAIKINQMGSTVNDSLSILDSLYFFDGNRNLIKKIAANGKNFDGFKTVIDRYETRVYYVGVKSKIGAKGKAQVYVGGFVYESGSQWYLHMASLGGTIFEVKDCSPKFTLYIDENNRKDGKYCQSEQPGVSLWSLNSFSEIPASNQKWYVNGKELSMKNQQHYWWFQLRPGFIELTAPTTKVLLKLTDVFGRVGYDSIIIDVLKNPVPKVAASKAKICQGDYVEIKADTIGLSKWAWCDDVPSNSYSTKIYEYFGGSVTFLAISNNGCATDTTIFITELPKQESLTIDSYDTLLWTNKNANKIEWLYSGVTFDSGQFISSKKSGFYQVHAVNEFGCGSLSDMFRFDYVEPKSVIDSSGVKIITNDKAMNGNVCPGEFHPELELIHLNQNSIKKADWSIGGYLFYTYDASCLCKLYPESIRLWSGNVKITVRVVLKDDRIKTDTIELNILPVIKPILQYDAGPYCSDRVINFTIKEPAYFLSVYWENGNKVGKTLSVNGPNGMFFAKATNTNGCISYSDTVEINSIFIPKPSLMISNCELFADIQFDTDKGSYNWIKNGTPIQITSKTTYKVDNDNGFWKVQFVHKDGCVSALSDLVFAQCKTSGTKNHDLIGSSIYPNPFRDQLMVESQIGDEVVFMNSLGQVVHKVSLQNNTEQIVLDIPVGIYFVKIVRDGQIVGNQKLLKQ